MSSIPKDYAEIEDSPPYRAAQRIGSSVVQHIDMEEYWHFFDPQEVRLLDNAKPGNITFYLDTSIVGYRIHVGLEGYVREPESYTRTIRRMLLMILWPEPPLPLKGTVGRPNEKKVTLRLPPEREKEIIQWLSPKELAAVIQAAFARKHRDLMRVYKNSQDISTEVLIALQRQYEKAMEEIIC